jgi:hypothetical protein
VNLFSMRGFGVTRRYRRRGRRLIALINLYTGTPR